MKNALYLGLIICTMHYACQDKAHTPQRIILNNNTQIKADTSLSNTNAIKAYPQDKACMALQGEFDSHISNVTISSREYLNEKNLDSCVLCIVDSLKAKFMNTQNIRYLDLLSAFCKESDGYISEGLGEVVYELFRRNTYTVANYLYVHRKDSARMLFLLGSEVKFADKQKETDSIVASASLKAKVKKCILQTIHSEE